MRRFHQVFGWSLFIFFLLTGEYMARYHNRLHGLPDGVRMLYRSRHIYILFAALMSIVLGLYFSWGPPGWRSKLQAAGSIVMVAATGLLILAFFRDPDVGPDQTIAYFGIIPLALGVLLHVIGGSKARES